MPEYTDQRLDSQKPEDTAVRSKTSIARIVIPFIVIIAVVMLLLYVMKMSKPEAVIVEPPPAGLVVETDKASKTNHIIQVDSQGVVMAQREIFLVPEIQGKIVAMSDNFAAGGRVQKDDILVRIDPADYEVAVERARAALASQQASLDLEQARSDQARKDWSSFGKKGEPSDLVLNIPQLKGARAAVEAAVADLRKAERDLAKTQIQAPFDGVVVSKLADIGQFVSIGSQLGQMANSAIAEVRLPITDRDMQKINWPDSDSAWNIEVQFLDDAGNTAASGNIVRLEASKDRNTLVNYAVAQIRKPFDQGLKLNAFLNAKISGKTLSDVYEVPVSYIMPNNQIGIYTENNTLDIKRFESLYQTDEFVYISSGINSQDAIVTTPIQGAYQGMLLRRPSLTAQLEQ
ncbi:efflux RND transporter periplasmic adaptor subunit [Marinicella sp. W31]|uniref:efflux RND transporter periplasmic adaptor subunit n=1 Tax=Marinicella sp. W31 TaxID=3023713 RepID=UPI003757748F